MSEPLAPGERVVLLDQRGRAYLFMLQTAGTYHTHSGTLAHDLLIGHPEGTRAETSGGMVVTAFRPRFADYALKMKRGAQVIYPKDLGPIMTYADIYPGARVLEAGTGSGAMTIALCRAVGDTGRDRVLRAARGAPRPGPEEPRGVLREDPGDARSAARRAFATSARRGSDSTGVCWTSPRPGSRSRRSRSVLEPGGVLCAYLPTTMQVQQLVLALPAQGFLHIETFEVLRRGWHVTDRSVRPDHRMVGHTGFLTIARRTA